MLIKSYKIVDVKRFEIFVEDITPSNSDAIIRVDKLAICKADLRYYLGNRDKRTLELKYPLKLVHEGIGTVLKDMSGKFSIGDKVTLVPNIHPNDCNNKICAEIGGNFCSSALFASSNYDGFSGEMVALPSQNIVKIKNDSSYFVFCELISIAVAATRRVKINNKSRVTVFGDGIVGYILCAVLKEVFGCTVFAVGKHREKLKNFTMCDNVYMLEKCNEIAGKFDTGFECVGGAGVESAVNSLASLVEIGGKLVITGVAEENIRLNARIIMEKGITLTGSTRSNVNDFEKAVELLDKEKFKNYIEVIILGEKVISNIDEYYDAFEFEVKNKLLGKNIYRFI